MKARTRHSILFGVGACLVLLGSVLGGCWMYIYNAIFKWQFVVSESSTSYRIWKDIPLPIYMEFTMFNVTNSAEVEKDPSVIPHVVEMGPYVWREYHTRVNFTWNNNDTLTYQQIRRWQFEPDLSKGNLSDEVTNFNAIAAAASYIGRKLPYLIRIFLSRVIDKTDSKLFVTHNVSDLIFDGYDDTMLDMVNKLNLTIINIPFTRFGYFVDRNNSADYDGWFNMYTGADDIYKLGILSSWNFQQHTGMYGRPCDLVRGTSGELWPPSKDYNDIYIFAPDICLSIPLTYEGPVEMQGVPGLQYVATNKTFDDGALFPETACLCSGECVPTGALNVSRCKWGAPIFVTLPHFYLAHPYYLRQSRGLTPDPAKHRLEFGMNAATGIPLYVNARMQLNLLVENFPNIRLFERFKQRRFVPMFWFNQRTEITPKLGWLTRLLLVAPRLGQGVFFGLAGVGALLLLTGLAAVLSRVWLDDDDDTVPLVDEDERVEAVDA